MTEILLADVSQEDNYLIVGAGAGEPIKWEGGDGTVSLDKTDAAAFVKDANGDTQAGPGDWNGATAVFEASFNGLFTDSFRALVDSAGIQLVFAENVLESKNFSLKACWIRPIVTGTPSGVGLKLSIQAR